MAKITSSSNRSKRSTKKPITQGQNPQRANRQSVSQARVSTSGQGTSGSAKVTRGRGDTPKGRATTLPNSARAGQNLVRQGAQQMRTIGDSGQVRAAAQRGQEIRKAAQTARGAKQAMSSMSNTLRTARTLRNIVGAAKMAGPAGAAAAVLAPRRLADATMKGKPTGNPQGPAVPKRLTQGGMDKGSFDSAFKASRSAGKKTFTWRGKKYNTKLRGE